MSSFTRFRKLISGEPSASQPKQAAVFKQEEVIETVESDQEIDTTSHETPMAETPIIESLSSRLKAVFGSKKPSLAAEEHVEKLKGMTKAELDDYAINYGIELDRRQTKPNMINEFIQKLKEKN
jgi:hypothetical protein